MGFWSSFVTAVAGAAEVALGGLIEAGSFGTLSALAVPLIISGAEMMGTGIYGMVTAGEGPQSNSSTTVREATAPWKILYGQVRCGGTSVYMNTWPPENNTILDVVSVLADHPCQSVDRVYFDSKLVQFRTYNDSNAYGIPDEGLAGYPLQRPPDQGAGTSFTPVQQTVEIETIERDSNGIVTVQLASNIPYLSVGSLIQIGDVNIDSGRNVNGTFPVYQIITQTFGDPGSIRFTIICGGEIFTPSKTGKVKTVWPNVGKNVYFEPMLGTQTLGTSFAGMVNGTPLYQMNKLTTPDSLHDGLSGTSVPNPWVPNTFGPADCSLVGKTAAFLRLAYDAKIFPSGVPAFSFLVSGKCDIWDPRDNNFKWTANSALVIADFLTNPDWGFGLKYGTDIPIQPLIDAANLCDERVETNLGTEARYETNGSFDLAQRKGEILQNLLTSCAGRIIITNGQYIIQPGQWIEPPTEAYDLQANAAGTNPIKWKPNVSIKDLVNCCKGTYISPSDNWQSTDFPAYALDIKHNYLVGDDWGFSTIFNNGSYAVYEGMSYLSLRDNNIGNVPLSSPDYWKPCIVDNSVQINADQLLIEDLGERRWLDTKLPFTTSYAMAQRLAKIELLRRRHQGTGTFTCNMSAYQFVPTDTIKVKCAYLGWENKLVEVTAVRLKPEHTNEGVVLNVELDLQETDNEIYQWSKHEELTPNGFQESLVKFNSYIETIPFPWSPGHVSPLPGDAVGGAASFGVKTMYGADGSGTPTAKLQIVGYPPITSLDVDNYPPQISSIVNESGGTLSAGTYVVGLSAWNNNTEQRRMTDYGDLCYCVIDGNTGSITISIDWSPGNDGGSLYIARWPDNVVVQQELHPEDGLVFHWNQDVGPGAETVTITEFNETFPGGPDTIADHLSVTWQKVVHGGIFAGPIYSVTSNSITYNGYGMTDNQFAGYTLSLISKFNPDLEIPILNMPVIGNTASDSNGRFVLNIGPGLPDLTTLLETDDVVCMRANWQFTDTSCSDYNWYNGIYPGLNPDNDTGLVAVVLSGANAGDMQTVSSIEKDNRGNYTVVNISKPWIITPASGDIVVLCSPDKAPSVDGAQLKVSNDSVESVQATVDVENLSSHTWLFYSRTCDIGGNYGADSAAPFREVFIRGNGLTSWVGMDYLMNKCDGRLTCDTTGGSLTVQLLPEAQVYQQLLMVSKISPDANTVTIRVADGDPGFENGSSTYVLYNQGDAKLLKFGNGAIA